MIQIADNLWIGGSKDEAKSGVVTAILNTAIDLQRTSHKLYVHIPLVDGPGNQLDMYRAAVYALKALLTEHTVLVCCHEGGRSLAVAMMYMQLITGRGWDELLSILHERLDTTLPAVHSAHKEAFKELK